jgi:hypothetical protein
MEDQQDEMSACETTAYKAGYFQSNPRRDNPVVFSRDLLEDSCIKMLLKKDEDNGKNALGAESPTDLVLRILPSDGHLE